MRAIKWLGVTVPEDVEKEILEAENKVGKSVDLLCGMCKRILEETKGVRRASRVSVESVSIFKNEIDAAHELFRRTQSMLLDFLGEPWHRARTASWTRSPSARPSIMCARRRRRRRCHPRRRNRRISRAKTGNGRGSWSARVWRSGWCWARFCESNARRRLIGWLRATKAVVNERSFVGIERSHRERIASKKDIPISNTYRIRTYGRADFGRFSARARRIYARAFTRGRPPPLTAGETSPRRVRPRPWRFRARRPSWRTPPHRDVRAEPGVHERRARRAPDVEAEGATPRPVARRPDPRTPVPTR